MHACVGARGLPEPVDPSLFPPPPTAAPGTEWGAEPVEEEDLDRAAFQAELERVAAQVCTALRIYMCMVMIGSRDVVAALVWGEVFVKEREQGLAGAVFQAEQREVCCFPTVSALAEPGCLCS